MTERINDFIAVLSTIYYNVTIICSFFFVRLSFCSAGQPYVLTWLVWWWLSVSREERVSHCTQHPQRVVKIIEAIWLDHHRRRCARCPIRCPTKGYYKRETQLLPENKPIFRNWIINITAIKAGAKVPYRF